MSNQYEITGKLIKIEPTQTFASGFMKRVFVVETAEKFPQTVPLEVVKDKCAEMDSFRIGEEINVAFNVRGNEHNGRYFCNLQAWKLTRVGGEQRSANQGGATPPARDNSAVDNFDDSDIPFAKPNLIWP